MTHDLFTAGFLKTLTQLQADWLHLVQHNYTPQTSEPFSVSILPQQRPSVQPQALRPARGDSDDVLARITARA